MDITTLAAWGEFLGGIAVVASLIYLAGQIRQNTALLKTSAAATIGDADTAIGSILSGDAELARTFGEGMDDPDSLSPGERARFAIVVDMMMRAFHRSFVFARGSGLDPSIWEVDRQNKLPFRHRRYLRF